MNKTTIEIQRSENHPAGYNLMNPVREDSPTVLDHIVEWARTPEAAGHKVYRHVVRYETEKVGELGEYDFTRGGGNGSFAAGHGIPRCHLVVYLDIYHQ